MEKRGQRSIFKTGFYMKTHKPQIAHFFDNLTPKKFYFFDFPLNAVENFRSGGLGHKEV